MSSSMMIDLTIHGDFFVSLLGIMGREYNIKIEHFRGNLTIRRDNDTIYILTYPGGLLAAAETASEVLADLLKSNYKKIHLVIP